MSATKALQSALDFGVLVEVSGDDLLLAAAVEPPASVLDALARHKLEIIGILASTDVGPTAEDWLPLFDERAGISSSALTAMFPDRCRRMAIARLGLTV
jgi:hypothetical protein